MLGFYKSQHQIFGIIFWCNPSSNSSNRFVWIIAREFFFLNVKIVFPNSHFTEEAHEYNAAFINHYAF